MIIVLKVLKCCYFSGLVSLNNYVVVGEVQKNIGYGYVIKVRNL